MAERLLVRDCQTLVGHCWVTPNMPRDVSPALDVSNKQTCHHCGATRELLWVITEGLPTPLDKQD